MKDPENELKRRRFLLTGSYVPVILSVAVPLLSQNCLTIIFQFFDIFTAANMNMNVVTTVSLVTEIKAAVSTVCGGLCVGAGIMISRSFGRGDMDEVRSQISTVFFMGIFAAAFLIAVTIPFSALILRLCSLPEELIPSSVLFFIISIIIIVFGFINSIFFATEIARGRTKIIMYGNLVIIIIKTSLNAIIITLVSTERLPLFRSMMIFFQLAHRLISSYWRRYKFWKERASFLLLLQFMVYFFSPILYN